MIPLNSSADRELETLAVAAHGGCVALHSLGLVWNVRRRNVLWSAFHFFAAVMSYHAVRDHLALRGGAEEVE